MPPQVLFPQIANIVRRYVDEKLEATQPADKKDVFLAPYYGWLVEVLLQNIRGDVEAGEVPELPLCRDSRGPGSTSDVDFWTAKDVREVSKSHVSHIVADTLKWEQTAAYHLDTHPKVRCFVKNAGMGFAIPYVHNGQGHDYVPDFIVRLETEEERYLILETKGYDPLAEVKKAAALRWVAAVNADGRSGRWHYEMVRKPQDVIAVVEHSAHP